VKKNGDWTSIQLARACKKGRTKSLRYYDYFLGVFSKKEKESLYPCSKITNLREREKIIKETPHCIAKVIENYTYTSQNHRRKFRGCGKRSKNISYKGIARASKYIYWCSRITPRRRRSLQK